MAFLSIIIAAHNAKDTLHTTLESLQNAIEGAGDDVEIIIFNDSSNDSTQDIIEAWLPMLPNAQSRYVEYRNVGHVRNSALSLATGEYITMLDSDDRMKPGSIRDAVAFLKSERPDMLLTRLLEIRDTKKMTADWQGFSPVALSQHEAIKRFLQHKDFQAHLIGQFIHRELYVNNPIPSMVCYEDFAVFPGMLMQSISVRDIIITSNVTTVCRAVSTPVKSLRWLIAHYKWKKHSLVLLSILLIVTGLISTETTGSI